MDNRTVLRNELFEDFRDFVDGHTIRLHNAFANEYLSAFCEIGCGRKFRTATRSRYTGAWRLSQWTPRPKRADSTGCSICIISAAVRVDPPGSPRGLQASEIAPGGT